jgi:L-asparaginase
VANRRVVVLALGGTISSSSSAAGGPVTPILRADDLLAAVPGLAELGVYLDAVDVRRVAGSAVHLDDVLTVAGLVRERVDAGFDGAVVTQGTDTIEETSYALDLLHGVDAPVVVTGAMRNPTLAGADGPANLLAAVAVAASPSARGLGCLVTFGDEIHVASRVRKTHTTSPATFVSANGGPLGYLVEGEPRLLNLPRRYVIGAPVGPLPRVAVVPATLGDDGALLGSIVDGVDGLVVAGFGVGHVPPPWVPVLAGAARRIPVVLASRTGAGAVLSATYDFPGSERDLQANAGLIPAGFLDAYKARILLMFALAAGADRAALVAAFSAAGGLGNPDAWPWG